MNRCDDLKPLVLAPFRARPPHRESGLPPSAMNTSFLLPLSVCTLTLLSPLSAQRGGGFTRSIPVMTALDSDGDGNLSMAEVQAAPASLAKLDGDKDGKLVASELMTTSSQGGGRGSSSARMMRMFPVIVALDKDGNGEVSSEERADTVKFLMGLDKDKDGELTRDELMPSFGGRSRGGRGGTPQKLQQPHEVEFKDGTNKVLDDETFEKLSYQGDQVLIDTHLTGVQFVKFLILEADGEEARIYFINTKTHRGHPMFSRAVGITRGGSEQMKGVLVYYPKMESESGTMGRYTYEFEPFDRYAFPLVKAAGDILLGFAPILKGKLSYHPMPGAMAQYKKDKEQYESAGLRVFLDSEQSKELANGVAVTDDIVYQTGKSKGRRYYVNTQVGEDLVTNPEAESIPEEVLLHPSRASLDMRIRGSNRVALDANILTKEQSDDLRRCLRAIHRGFRWNYEKEEGARYSMEIEFKVSAEGKLVIKQARPWVY